MRTNVPFGDAPVTIASNIWRTAVGQGGDLSASAEIALDDRAKFFPTDAALASWIAQAHAGEARVVYE